MFFTKKDYKKIQKMTSSAGGYIRRTGFSNRSTRRMQEKIQLKEAALINRSGQKIRKIVKYARNGVLTVRNKGGLISSYFIEKRRSDNHECK